MPLPDDIAERIDLYARADLPGDLTWHIEQVRFLRANPALQRRVGEEFYTARYLYKVLEGLRSKDAWMQAAQVKVQILQYASVYEACLHYLLFSLLKQEPAVKALPTYETLTRYSVPPDKLQAISHDGKEIVPAYVATKKAGASKVRFEHKVKVAVKLKVVTPALGDELRAIYSARNSIHLHAELKKGQGWPVDLGRLAYRRMQPFCEQLNAFVDQRESGST